MEPFKWVRSQIKLSKTVSVCISTTTSCLVGVRCENIPALHTVFARCWWPADGCSPLWGRRPRQSCSKSPPNCISCRQTGLRCSQTLPARFPAMFGLETAAMTPSVIWSLSPGRPLRAEDLVAPLLTIRDHRAPRNQSLCTSEGVFLDFWLLLSTFRKRRCFFRLISDEKCLLLCETFDWPALWWCVCEHC